MTDEMMRTSDEAFLTVCDALKAGFTSLVIHLPGGAEAHRLVAYPESEDLRKLAYLIANIHVGAMTGASLTQEHADKAIDPSRAEHWLWGQAPA